MAFTEGFGMTETAPIAACLQPEDVLEHAGSIGRPVGSVDFRIVDEDGRDVPTGEVNVFVGYWGKPQATAEAIRGGWFHTGDLGRVDEEGFYTLVDRKKDMVITGGENVYPIEVEQVIYEHADVMEVAVTGAPDDKWGEMIVATVVRVVRRGQPGHPLTPADHCRRPRRMPLSDVCSDGSLRVVGLFPLWVARVP